MQKKSRLGTLKSFIVMLNPLAYVGMYGHHIRIGYRANKKSKKFLAYHRNSTLYTMGTLILTFIINQQNSNYLKKILEHFYPRIPNTTGVLNKSAGEKWPKNTKNAFFPVFELMSDSLTTILVEPYQCPSHQSILLTQGLIHEIFMKKY